MSWGWKIFIGYTSFVLFILYMVYRAVGVDFELVTPDYYGAEMGFQGQIDRTKAANDKGYNAKVLVVENGINVQFSPFEPGAVTSGKVIFFRPSSVELDREFQWKVDEEGSMFLPNNQFQRGQYTFKLDGVYNGTAFYIEDSVFIP